MGLGRLSPPIIQPNQFQNHIQQVGEKPHYQRTLWGILSVTALPMLVAGVILSGFGFLAVCACVLCFESMNNAHISFPTTCKQPTHVMHVT